MIGLATTAVVHQPSGVLLRVTSAVDDHVRHAQAVDDLNAFADFVHTRVPSAIRPLHLELVDAPGHASGGSGHVALGRAGGELPWDPSSSTHVVGHELTHALVDSTANFAVHELDADLVGAAFARSTGRVDDRAWPSAIVRSEPAYPTVEQFWSSLDSADEVIAQHAGDTHHTGGPVLSAINAVRQQFGVDVVDEVAVRAVLDVKPRTDAALRDAQTAIFGLDQSDAEQGRALFQLMWRDEVDALATAADELYPDRPEIGRAFIDGARAVGIDVR